MLRCRRCRKSLIDSSFITMQVQDSEESSAAVCSIWHVNVDTLPEWILASVNQAQWTVGKLNCHHCGARLGGFNFINRSECPCGRDATVHLSKSRVDHEHKQHVLIVQPRRARPERGGASLLTHGSQGREGTPPRSSVGSHIDPAEASGLLTACDYSPSFTFSPLYCISQKRRRSLEDEDDFSSSCFCPAAPPDVSAAGWTRLVTDEPSRSPASLLRRQQLRADGGASNDVRCSIVSGGARSSLELQPAEEEEEEEVESAEEAAEEPSDTAMFLRGRSISDSVAEQPEVLSAPVGSPASSRLSKREKNRLKSLRRKQRRRERWLHSQLEQAESVSTSLASDGGGDEEEEEDGRDGLTCAVCLDVYFSPYSCQPCGHVFCEPCLRTLAKNRPTSTPCPLCRTLISHTSFHKELNHTVKNFFPKVQSSRKQNFQSAPCARWPLPSCRQRFRPFWGYQRRAATAGRRWHFVHGGFTLEALDLADMRGWLFDIGLVIVYIHSLNRILAFLFLCFLLYYFFF
ncbi:unnamed protein product [Ophioblennius macclurei]